MLLLLLFCLAAAPSCAVYHAVAKFTGIESPPVFDPNKEIPEDFKLSVDVRDVSDPPKDYLLVFERNGKATYDVTIRSPRRKRSEGEFEITEDNVRGLWKAVAAAKFDKLSARYPKDGEGGEKRNGVQTFYVFAGNTEHRVEAHFETNESLESIRRAAIAAVPPSIFEGKGLFTGPAKEYIGDVATHVFHHPECPKLKDVPPANRQPFATPWDAVNYSFKPCSECQPMKSSAPPVK